MNLENSYNKSKYLFEEKKKIINEKVMQILCDYTLN